MGMGYLDLGVGGRDAEADEAVGEGEGFVEVDFGGGELGENTIGGVKAGRAGANDSEAKWMRSGGGGEAAVVVGCM